MKATTACSSKLAVRATFFCAAPGCQREALLTGISRIASADRCLVEIELPADWTVRGYLTFCPGHSAINSSEAWQSVQIAMQEFREAIQEAA